MDINWIDFKLAPFDNSFFLTKEACADQEKKLN